MLRQWKSQRWYLEKSNKDLVIHGRESLGVQAVGISGKDGGLLKVEKEIFQGTRISVL